MRSLYALPPLLWTGLALAVAAATPARTQAPLLGQTRENLAAGGPGTWDLTATDVTVRSATGEVWIADPYCSPFPEVKIFRLDDLARPPRSLPLEIPPPLEGRAVLGIGEVPHGALRGNVFVLVDPSFGTDLPPSPFLGVLDPQGSPVPGTGFAPVFGLSPQARLSSIDVHPERDELAAYDMATHSAYILDFGFEVVMGPIPLDGNGGYFTRAWRLEAPACSSHIRGAGTGIAFDGPDGLLVTTGITGRTESCFVLRYDLARDGHYSGTAIDLSAARRSDPALDVTFLAIDTTTLAGSPALLALNAADEALYAFELLAEPHAPAATISSARVDPDTGRYTIEWEIEPPVPATGFSVFENGVRVARLPPGARTFTSPSPLSGKARVEVATEDRGVPSGLRAFAVLENSRPPAFDSESPAVEVFEATQVRYFEMSGCAVTRTPSTPEQFRAYLIGRRSNEVRVFDHTLRQVDVITPDPPASTSGGNTAAIGVALAMEGEEEALVILDPDGPQNSGGPGLTIHSLESCPPGRLLRAVHPIDLSALPSRPVLYDFDADGEGHFVAAGKLLDDRFVIVRIALDAVGARAVAWVPSPWDAISRGGPVRGIGVSVLPSGNLLVLGGDRFQKSYAEALLMTPFRGALPDELPRLVGFAAGLPLPGRFFSSLGPELGPGLVFGLETAFFPVSLSGTSGTSVCYVPTVDVEILHNRAARQVLEVDADLFIQAEVDAALAHPGLVAEPLGRAERELAPGMTEYLTAPLGPLEALDRVDIVVYVMNRATGESADIELEASLGGQDLDEMPGRVLIAPGRFFRFALNERPRALLEIALTNRGTSAAQLGVFSGGRGVLPEKPSRFGHFRRGDCDGDGELLLADAVFCLAHLFRGGPTPECPDACDSDDSGRIDISDAIVGLRYLFLQGVPPASPGPHECGEDAAPDELAPCATRCAE